MMRFSVIGHPVAHSLSPTMHAANFRALDFDGAYTAVDVTPEDLEAWLRQAARGGLRGVNVTIPHKVAALSLMDTLDESAVCYGAVNTVLVTEAGALRGYNTDVDGFLDDLRRLGVEPNGIRALVCGAGGAGRALARGLAAAGADVQLANRTPRPEALTFGSDACLAAARAADLVVNATALGLKPDDPAVLSETSFRREAFFYDCAPVRHETRSMAAARAAGCRTANGRGMLVAQGARAFEIWTGRAADREAMFRAIEGKCP